jgi:hypothetical protein
MVYVLAGCGDTWQPDGPDTFGGSCGSAGQLTTLTQTKHWRIFWTDGYERKDAQVQEEGQCKSGVITDTKMLPRISHPLLGRYVQQHRNVYSTDSTLEL